MVVVLIDGVVKLVLPLANADPPDAAAYQSIVSPVPGVAESDKVPVPQRDAPVTGEGVTGFVGATSVAVPMV